MASESFVIKTPCSSANIGPGFDVIGLALSLYLELHVTIDRSKERSEEHLNLLSASALGVFEAVMTRRISDSFEGPSVQSTH